MSEYDGLINEFCWDYLEWIRKGCSPFNKSFYISDGLCMNAMWWYRQKFGIYNSGPMREAMEQIFFKEFDNRSYPFNKSGTEFHDENPTTNHKRIAWCKQRALKHKPLPFDPLDATDLFNADPACKHVIRQGENGGVQCVKCGGWFCF